MEGCWMDGMIDRRMDGKMEGQMVGWMDGCSHHEESGGVKASSSPPPPPPPVRCTSSQIKISASHYPRAHSVILWMLTLLLPGTIFFYCINNRAGCHPSRWLAGR